MRALAVLLFSVTLAACGRTAPIAPPLEARPTPPAPPVAPVIARTLPNGEPILMLPVPAGEVVHCQQGNRSPKPASHAHPNTLHALDLGIPGDRSVPIVASASGVVSRVVRGAKVNVDTPGEGFGNVVAIDHEGGWHTSYAHLEEVTVEVGQAVTPGQVIGSMGETGMAGNVHVHWSLHRGHGPRHVVETVPMHAIVAVDANEGARIALFSSLEIICSASRSDLAGHFYQAVKPETAVFAPLEPAASSALLTRVERRRAAVGDSVESALAALGKEPAERVRGRLEALLAKSPADPVPRYWLGVLSVRDLRDLDAAERWLTSIDFATAPPSPWMRPWTLAWLAVVAEQRGAAELASKRLVEARAIAKGDAELEGFLGALEKRLGSAVPTTSAPRGRAGSPPKRP